MITHIQGDCIAIAKEKDSVIIPHIVNDIGAWGSGFVLDLSEEWPISLKERSPEYIYRNIGYMLGGNTYCHPEIYNDEIKITVVNMCAQHGISSKSTGDRSKINQKPIRYVHLVSCMKHVANLAICNKAEIVCPKFGSGRAGGNWNFIEELIEEIWGDFNVTVCSLS